MSKSLLKSHKQKLLDLADYWARASWGQMMPIFIEKEWYCDAKRIDPSLDEYDIIETPGRFQHHAPVLANMNAMDARWRR